MTTAHKLWLGFGLLTGLLVLLGAGEIVRLSSAEAGSRVIGLTLALLAVAVVIAVATGVVVGRGVLRSERSLREGEERYRTLVEASPQMVWALRPDWTMAFVSRTWIEFTGLTAEQAAGAKDRDALFHPDDLPGFLASIAGPWERGEAHEVVARWRCRDGEYRWTRSRAVPVKDERGSVVLWIGTTVDIHEQRLAEEALRKSQDEYRLLVETNPALICRFRGDGTLTFVNDTYCQAFGQPRDELVGRRFLPLVPPEDHRLIREMLAALAPDMGPYVHEHRVIVADGSVRWQQWTNRPIAGAGRDAEYQAVGIDVTDRKRAEALATESEHRLRAILDTEPECVKLLAADGTLLEMNPAGLAMIDAASMDEVVGQNVRALVCPEHRDAFADLIRRVFGGQTGRLEFRATGLKGTVRWLEMHATPFRDRDGKIVAVLGVTRDVTERKRLEERVGATRLMLETVLNNIPQGVFWKDRTSRYLGCNAVVSRAFGLAASDDVVGKTDYDLPGLQPEQAAFFIQKDREVMELGKPMLGIVEPATLPDGSTIWMETNKIPLRDAAGRVIGILGTWQDITARKRMEEQLQQSQKMDAVGQLAGGVAHDFNNLLTVINGYADLLLTRVPAADPMHQELEQVRNAGERAAGLTRQLLAFSRRTVMELKVLDLNAVVSESERMLRRVIGEDIELTVKPKPGLYRVKADPGQVGQILLNLALNSRDAMPRGGKLTIQTCNAEIDEVFTTRRPEVKPGEYALLSVSDTGQGMTAEVRARIFEPFFTTKGPGKGTGLGLAVVHGIVQQSGGFIEVASEPDRGATFRVYLPVIEEEAGPLSRLVKKRTAKPGTETVLLVEDEEGVRQVGELALRTHGYTVLVAANAAEALRVMDDQRDGIAILVTDVVMPGMSGSQLADSLRGRYPKLKVLFMSGYTADAVLRHGILDGAENFLHKPFTPVSLANKVREILDKE
jgi:two-component system, cell cycle sensor histidine kinase and response regulator CckA